MVRISEKIGISAVFWCTLSILFLHCTCISQDGKILLQIKESDWIDRGNRLRDWNASDENPCSWNGISCNSSDIVTAINLTDTSISGNLSSTICLLPGLEELILSGNAFELPFPDGLFECRSLQLLDLSVNLFFGSLPSRISEFRQLKILDLGQNNFTGSIPPAIGLLENIEELSLNKNHFHGTIPANITALSRLTRLLLWDNNLSGPIPSNIDDMRSLSVLDLSLNNISGEIPYRIANLASLDQLGLSDNQLTGEIPAGIGKLRNLTRITLYGNKLKGWLPQDLGAYSDFSFIDVTETGLEGPLPKNLCKNRMLYGLALASNNFNGSIPSSLEDCESLQYVQLNNNQLSGGIPAGFWSSSSRVQLILDNNKFEGQISAAIGQAKSLASLQISNNQLSGSIPPEIGQLTNIQILIAGNNQFSGSIPNQISGMTLISTLQLDHNFLSGEIPKGLKSLKKLSTLNLASNRLTGEIPASLGNLPTLNNLDLSNNVLSGEIPAELGQLSLTIFNLSGNLLHGPVPAALNNSAYKDSFLNNRGLCGAKNLMLKECSSGKASSQRLAAILVPSVMFAAMALGSVCVYWFCFRKSRGTPSWKLTSFNLPELDELHILRNLLEENVIGSGGAGKIYKVVFPSGEVVAVKKIRNSGKSRGKFRRKGEHELGDVEVDTLGLIRHNNILKLLCCISSEESDFKLLVYEYMPNGSLLERLQNPKGPETVLPWPIRYKIAVSAARGLSYMHHDCTPPILHRDVKSSNILLDKDFEAKIADFDLARVLHNLGEEYSVSGYVGSHGYIAPEYAHGMKVSGKTDVYSFGVVMLEVVSGMKATNEVEYGEGVGIVEWMCRTIRGRGELGVLDWRILEEKYIEQMLKVLRVGLVCTQRNPKQRPSMRKVVEMLEMCNGEEEERGNIFITSRRLDANFSPTTPLFQRDSEREES